MSKPKLTEKDYKFAANILLTGVADIKAVAEVESLGSGFLPTDEPVILFERHIFSKLTSGKYDKSNPDISNKSPGGYGSNGVQHARLENAAKLDATYYDNGTVKTQPNREAALKSASWGKFQILGMNYKLAGFNSLQEFINAMYNSEEKQLIAFVHFLKNTGLDKPLREHRWADFARGYNGPGYAKNSYHTKLQRAYEKYSK